MLLIGGPSATTVLVIEQARSLGFKGGFVVIDQAKPDYIAKVIKDMKVLEGMISTGALKDLPLPAVPTFSAKYKAAYKRDKGAENVLNYNAMYVLARAIEAGGSTLRDFMDAKGKPGYFQQSYKVYGRRELPCHDCGTLICEIRQGQRSTCYCPHCQPM